MLSPRVIPVLLLKNEGLYKGEKFKKHKYVGDPINTVKIFNDKEVDEVVLLDIEATLKGRKPDFKLLESIASEAFMPFAYGGGVGSYEDAKRIFHIGYEKVVLGAACVEKPELVEAISASFGSQSVVVSVDVRKNFWGKYAIFSHSSNKRVSSSLEAFVKEMESRGAGEIFLNNIDRDGAQSGYDLDLIGKVVAVSSLPVVACGGAGSFEHLIEGLNAGAHTVAAGSMFVLQGPHKAVLIKYLSKNELLIINNRGVTK